MQIHELTELTGHYPSTGQVIAVDTGTVTRKLYYENLAKAIVEQYNGSTIGGAQQTVKAAIEAVLAKENTDSNNILAAIAPTFDPSAAAPYAAGTLVWYNGTLYCFTADHTGAWTGTDAVNVNVGGEISSLKNALGETNGFISDVVNYNRQLLPGAGYTTGYYYYVNGSGNLTKGGAGTSNNAIYEPIPVKGGTTYYYRNLYGYFCILDQGGVLSRITESTSTNSSGSFTPSVDGAIYVTIQPSANVNILSDGPWDYNMTANTDFYRVGLAVDGYVHIKIASFSNGGDYENPIYAVRQIHDSSETKQYMLDIYPGTYHLDQAIGDAEKTGTKWGLKLPNYVHMRGIGNRDDIILDCSLANDASSRAVEYTSTLNLEQNNAIENLTLTGTNVRYVVHDESSNTYKNWKRIVKNCKIMHNGNAEGFWAYTDAWGEGCSSGSYSFFEDCIFENKSYVPPYKFHTNTNFESACTHIFKNCQFIQDYYGSNSAGSFGIVDIQCGKPINVEFVGCTFSCFIYVENQSSATDIDELNITGCGNSPVFVYAYRPNVANPSNIFAKFSDEVAMVYNATSGTISAGKCVRHWNYTRNQVGIESSDGTGCFGIALDDIPSHEIGYVKYSGILSLSTVGVTGVSLNDRVGIVDGNPSPVTDGKYFARAIQNNIIEFC